MAANEEPEVKRSVLGGVKRKRLVFSDSDEDAITPTTDAATSTKTIVPPRDDLSELQSWNFALLPSANGVAVSKDTIIIQKEYLIRELRSEISVLRAAK